MRIVASQVALSAATSVTPSTSESTQGRFWIGERFAPDGVPISNEARDNALSVPTGSQAARALLIADASQQNRSPANGTRNSSRPPTTTSTSRSTRARMQSSPNRYKLSTWTPMARLSSCRASPMAPMWCRISMATAEWTTGIYLTEEGRVRPLEQIDVKA